MKLKVIRMDDATTKDMEGSKLVDSNTHIGWFNFTLPLRWRLFEHIILSKHPLSKTRLLSIRVRKFGVSLYNYRPMFSFHKSGLTYGVHILFLRLMWVRY